MKMSEVFPSKFLKAGDVPKGKKIELTMSRVEMQDIGDDHKPVLYFSGKEKGLVLNKINSATIAAGYGDDSDNWEGQKIMLYASMTHYQGNPVSCLRVELPMEKAEFEDDDIPF